MYVNADIFKRYFCHLYSYTQISTVLEQNVISLFIDIFLLSLNPNNSANYTSSKFIPIPLSDDKPKPSWLAFLMKQNKNIETVINRLNEDASRSVRNSIQSRKKPPRG